MALRDLVKEVHTQAEECPFARLLMSGNITAEQYATYLFNQEEAYRYLETQADTLGILNEIPHIKRTEKIQADLKAVRQLVPIKHPPVIRVLPSVRQYINYVNDGLTEEQCWAHIYVRHFGDMYGGNMISKRIPLIKHTMYDFEDKKGLIEYVRAKLTDNMADEAKLVFKSATKLFRNLENEFNL